MSAGDSERSFVRSIRRGLIGLITEQFSTAAVALPMRKRNKARWKQFVEQARSTRLGVSKPQGNKIKLKIRQSRADFKLKLPLL